jgi:rhodanese-related sulfurtransferase
MLTVVPGATPPASTLAAEEPGITATDAWRDPSLRISIDDFERLARSGGHTLIDVRDEGMFARGHIPGAILIPLEDVEESGGRLRGLKQPFITYCS